MINEEAKFGSVEGLLLSYTIMPKAIIPVKKCNKLAVWEQISRAIFMSTNNLSRVLSFGKFHWALLVEYF